jgi:hypothetical protein
MGGIYRRSPSDSIISYDTGTVADSKEEKVRLFAAVYAAEEDGI